MKYRAFLTCLIIHAACGVADKPAMAPILAMPAAADVKAPSAPDEVALKLQAQLEQALLPATQVRGEHVHFTLAERMAKYRVPGLSIAVFDNYELLWAKGYGVTDIETDAKVTEATLFKAGSISKAVNALAVLMAVSGGSLQLDAPINELLRSWKLPENELTRTSKVTLRRLLSHTAGTSVHGFPGYPAAAPLPTLLQVLEGKPPANTPAVLVELEPGSKFRYSGGGTTITQLLLIDTFARPYPELLEERVLGPLGMRSSSYEQPLPPDHLALAAAGHEMDGTLVPGKRYLYPEMAAAGLWTTPTDLATFFREIALARANRSKLVPQDVGTQMTTAVDKESPTSLGMFLFERNGAALFGHNGAERGFQTNAIVGLDRGHGLVVMANSENGARLFPEIERTVFAALGWPGADPLLERFPLSEEQRARMLGQFQIAGGVSFVISPSGEQLLMTLPFLDPDRMIPVDANVLVRESDGIHFIFRGHEEVELANGGKPVDKARRLPAGSQLPLVELAAGRFDGAVKLWKRLLHEDPASVHASEDMHDHYAHDLMGNHELAAALQLFRAITLVFPDSPRAFDHLGGAYMAAGDRAAAITAYEAALSRLDATPRLPPEFKLLIRARIEAQLAALHAAQ